MRFIGNKEKLLFFLDQFIEDTKIKGQIFCDLFSGTTQVAQHFKRKGYNIISNDTLFFSYVLQKTYIENNLEPNFSKLIKWFQKNKLYNDNISNGENTFTFLNELKGKEGYFYDNYAPGGRFERKYLTDENAKKIDRIVNAILYWRKENLIDEIEEFIIKTSLIEAIPYVSNISGTYGAFLKTWDKRALKSIFLKIPNFLYSNKSHFCFNKDANELVKEIEADILYIDPPYNTRSYISNYHLLETISKSDFIELKGKTGLRTDDNCYKSKYNSKGSARDALSELINCAKAKHIILSYNSDGIIEEKFIESILRQRGKNYIKAEENYRRFNSNRKNGDNNVKEFLYYVEIPAKKYFFVEKNVDKVADVMDKSSIQNKLFDENADSKGKFGISRGERGIYDVRNKLNDLTGKEWVFRTNSIEIINSSEEDFKLYSFIKDILETKYSTKGQEGYSHNLRSMHPSPKPPQLMKLIIEFFTKESQWILDPFMGVGGTLLGASICNRNALGIDISKKFIDIYRQVAKKENLLEQIAICANSKNIETIPQVNENIFDLILTDPPYGNMMLKKKTGEKVKKKKNTDPTPFTEDKDDIGNMDLNEFLNELKIIIEKSVKFLKFKGYLVLFAKDFQPNKVYNGLLHNDIIEVLSQIKSLQFKGYKIWFDKTVNLYPYGYPYAYISNQLHQFILIFRKEYHD